MAETETTGIGRMVDWRMVEWRRVEWFCDYFPTFSTVAAVCGASVNGQAI